MRKLSYPKIDSEKLWDEIVDRKTEKNKREVAAVAGTVKARYAEYEANFGSLEKVEALPEKTWGAAKDALNSCYESRIFKAHRKEFLGKVASLRCPYCELSIADTLDHYFPQAQFPEFSVYVPNLVPCCGYCNRTKLENVKDEKGVRLYIHFYHDEIPEEPFLHVHISKPDSSGVADVDPYIEYGKNKQFEGIAKNHFDRLSLIDKYQNVMGNKLAEIEDTLTSAHNEGLSLECTRKLLECEMKALLKKKGENNWETAMYREILKDPDFFRCYWDNIT